MIKQSRNAVTMLLSCFKGIYQSAYVKGIASAVVLTAGLAAGAANAADVTTWNGDVTVDDTDSLKVSGSIPAATGTVTVVSGSSHTIGGAAETVIGSDADRNASLDIKNGKVTIQTGSSTSQGTTVYLNELTVGAGATLAITSSYDGSSASLEALVDARTITVAGSDTAAATVILSEGGTTGASGTSTLGGEASVITLGTNSNVQLTGTDSGDTTIKGATLNITGGSTAGSVQVDASKYGNIEVTNVAMSAGSIQNKGKLDITGTKVAITGGTLNNAASAELTLNADTEISSEAVLTNAGKIKIGDAKTLTVDAADFAGGALLHSTVTEEAVNFGSNSTLKIVGNVDLTSTANNGILGGTTFGTLSAAASLYVTDTLSLGTEYGKANLTLQAGTLDVDGKAGVFTIGTSSAAGSIVVADDITMSTTAADTAKTQTITLGSGANTGTLTLGVADVTDLTQAHDLGALNFTTAGTSSSTKLAVAVGDWVTAGDVTVAGSGSFAVNKDASFTGGKLTATNDTAAIVSVADGAEATFDTVDVTATANKKSVQIAGTLTVLGDEDVKDSSGKVTTAADSTVDLKSSDAGAIEVTSTGKIVVADSTNVLGLKVNSAGTGFDIGSSYKTVANSGTIVLSDMNELLAGSKLASGLNAAAVNNLTTTLMGAAAGVIDIGTAQLDFTGLKNEQVDGSYKYSEVSFANKIVNEQTRNMSVNVEATTTEVTGNWAYIANDATTWASEDSVKVGAGTLGLWNAQADSGYLVYKKDATTGKRTVQGLELKAGSIVNLNGDGMIGKITTASGHGTLNINAAVNVVDAADNTKNEDVGATDARLAEINVDGSLTAKNIYAHQLHTDNGAVKAESLTLGSTSNTSAHHVSDIDGGSVNVKNFTVEGATSPGTNTVTFKGGADVEVTETFKAGAGAQIYIGEDSDAEKAIPGSSAFVFAKNADINGATITIDPDYGDRTAVYAIESHTTSSTLNAKINVGTNAAYVYGFADREDVQDALSTYQRNGSLSEELGSVVILNKAITVDGTTGGISLSGIATPGTTEEGSSDPVDVDEAAANTINLGKNSALIITRNAFDFSATGTAAVTFSNAAGGLQANGGKVILDGIFTADDNGTNLFGFGGTTATLTLGADQTSLAVEVGNGVIRQEVTAADIASNTIDLDLAIDDDRLNALNASAAAKELVRDSFEDYSAEEIDDNAGLSFVYLAGTGYGQDGSAIDAAANLAVFGGAAQTALMASQTTTDVISARMGVGNVNSALMYADNASGAGIWLAPVYKNHDSDSFDANGVDYGADIDLTGVAFGADFTTDEGLRFGAMFNIGTGDADGQGAASAVSNDFDYYALGLYAGASFDKFSLVGDLTYAQSSNDIEMNSIIGKMDADTDVSALSFGLTGQYEFNTEVLDILPHVGVRFTQLEMDSYDVKVGGDAVAASDSDTMNIVSIPVGVTFAREIAAGEWYVKPALDLAVTMNTGDNELDTDTSFGPMSMEPVSAEVIDDVTYSVGLGLSARYNALSLGLGVNYVGSDNADELGVNGMARYSF